MILDSASAIEWWLRNDPALFSIPTPTGRFEPDFIYRANLAGGAVMGILEVKGEIFWDGEGSEARVKSDAACEWVNALRKAGVNPPWEFTTVLEQDAVRATSLEELRGFAVRAFPDAGRGIR